MSRPKPLALLALLALPGAAWAFDSVVPAKVKSDADAIAIRKKAERDVAPCPYENKKDCRCPYERAKKQFKVVIYGHNGYVNTPYSNDIEFSARYALTLRDVELAKPPENDQGTGGNQIFSYPDPALFEGKVDEKGKKLEWRPRKIDDFIDLCVVVRTAMAKKTFPGYLPVFFVAMGDSLRKQIGTDVAGEFFPNGGFSKKCDEVVGEKGVPAVDMAFVDMTPDGENNKQTFIHELGHAVGHSAGKPAVFADRYPDKDKTFIRNVMASRQAVSKPEDMQMTAPQVAVLCSSPYLR